MRLIKTTAPIALLFASALAYSAFSLADVWVFEPSISLDQRFDDNFYLDDVGPGSLSATRAVGQLGLNREGPAYSISGLARLDSLLVSNTDVSNEGLDSNGILIFDASRLTARSRYNFLADFTVDTPSRDIEADISDEASVGENTGLLVAQSLLTNVARKNLTIEPRFEYDLTRRLEFNTSLSYTNVEHDRVSPNDAIYNQYLNREDLQPEPGEPFLPYGSEEVRDLVQVFSPTGELDDFQEAKISMGLRYKLSPVSTLITSASYSRFDTETTTLAGAPFELLTADPQDRFIFRQPKFKSVSTTSRLTLGLERFLSPTLQLSVNGGLYASTTGFRDTLVVDDELQLGEAQQNQVDAINQELSDPDETTDGFIAGIGLTYDAGLTRYQVRFAVDVQPSSAGAQAETNQLTGELQRKLSPRLDFSLYASAFEPARLGLDEEGNSLDDFSRRYISFQPRLQWKYTRNWTLTAAYRYRRQRAVSDPLSAESNAVLFAIEYSPPSKIRDALGG